MVYIGQSLFGDQEPCVYLISYTIVYINPRQADEMTPSPGPIAEIQPPTSNLFQNLNPNIKPKKKPKPQGGRIIPEIPLLNVLPPIELSTEKDDPILPKLPKMLLACNPGDYPFPIDPSDMDTIDYIYRPHETLKFPIGIRPDNVWPAYYTPVPENFIIDRSPMPKVVPEGAKWLPYFYMPVASIPGGNIHLQPRYILVTTDYKYPTNARPKTIPVIIKSPQQSKLPNKPLLHYNMPAITADLMDIKNYVECRDLNIDPS
jgi:hypothetical protein